MSRRGGRIIRQNKKIAEVVTIVGVVTIAGVGVGVGVDLRAVDLRAVDLRAVDLRADLRGAYGASARKSSKILKVSECS